MMATKLEPAYKSEAGLPYHSINPVTGQATGSLVWLSDITTGMLENAHLSDVTDDPRYKRRCELAKTFLVKIFAHNVNAQLCNSKFLHVHLL